MKLIRPSFEILTSVDRSVLQRIERAGRTCYQSADKISDGTAVKFCKNIIKLGHESVLEHESISVKFIIDRGISHELVRHRIASHSQESTRYVNYKEGVTFIIPSWMDIKPGEYTLNNYLPLIALGTPLMPKIGWFNLMLTIEYEYKQMLEEGWTPQQARSILPNSLKTEIVTTANIREWRTIFKLRCSPKAHPQMREIMLPLLETFKQKIPVLFDDIQNDGIF
jgi:thymidylate synthase (FAD)